MSVQEIIEELKACRDKLELATANNARAQMQLLKAKQAYEQAEVRFALEALMMSTGKNSETRKVEVDLFIWQERQDGGLTSLWKELQQATEESNLTSLNLELAKISMQTIRQIASLMTDKGNL